MDKHQWIALFEKAFYDMSEKLEQTLQLNSCREHWIQAEISVSTWLKSGVKIRTDLPIGNRRKVDLFAEDENHSPVMIAELKCLGDVSQAKCLEGTWSIRSDIERLRSFECPVRLFVLVIAKGTPETKVGLRLRGDKWVDERECDRAVDLGFALIRMWAL